MLTTSLNYQVEKFKREKALNGALGALEARRLAAAAQEREVRHVYTSDRERPLSGISRGQWGPSGRGDGSALVHPLEDER